MAYNFYVALFSFDQTPKIKITVAVESNNSKGFKLSSWISKLIDQIR